MTRVEIDFCGTRKSCFPSCTRDQFLYFSRSCARQIFARVVPAKGATVTLRETSLNARLGERLGEFSLGKRPERLSSPCVWRPPGQPLGEFWAFSGTFPGRVLGVFWERFVKHFSGYSSGNTCGCFVGAFVGAFLGTVPGCLSGQILGAFVGSCRVTSVTTRFFWVENKFRFLI